MPKKIIIWEPKNFKLEMDTVWSFPNRGEWATHDSKWRGNWSPYVPRNLLLRYSNERDLVLDQFVGGGTTLVEAKLLNRDIIGIDINERALFRCKEKCDFKRDDIGKVYIRKGDARNLDFIPDKSIDFICTHPPYANIIKYSKELNNDLSLLKKSEFLIEMETVARESYRVLKNGKFCAILMGDTREKGFVKTLSFDVMNSFIIQGFELKEIIVKKQHNCRNTDYWKENSIKYNFLLIAHEYLFVFKKL